MASFQFFDVQQSGEITELRLKDPTLFDLVQNELLRNAVVEFIQQRRPSKLLVDFSDVRHCSSAVIAAMLTAQGHLMSEGHQMKLCGMNGPIRDNFRLLKLDGTIFDILATKADAVRRLSEIGNASIRQRNADGAARTTIGLPSLFHRMNHDSFLD